MLFKDEHDFSLLPKVVFLAAIILSSLLAGYLMFVNGENLIAALKPYAINGNSTRHLLLAGFLLIYIIRLFITVFVFLKRKWAWSEMLIVAGLMSFALFSFAKIGGNSQDNIHFIDYIAVFLYLAGSLINTHSEFTRYSWKKRTENKGKIYTAGLFKYSMHINYFGDVILFIGFAMITLSLSMLLIPLAMALNFIFFIIPRLDKYLAKKYGDEFKDYASKTKKLIPGIY